MDHKLHTETLCIQACYSPASGEPRQIPIIQSTTFKYSTSEDMGKLFDLEAEGYFYSRLQNPTCDMVAAKIAAMEGGTAAMLTGSGQAATFYALFNIASCGDHIVASSAIYGGSFNLLSVTMKRMGIETTFVNPDCTMEELNAAFKPNTKAVFGETIANPALTVLDIEKFANAAHAHGVPLIVDNTFATPINCRPFEWGADIVTHSTPKYMDGHASAVGGCIVDRGKFDWTKYPDKFPGLCTPDESYHGLTYATKFGKAAYITKATAQLMRDFGSIQSPQNAYYIQIGLESLPVRMARHCANAQKVAEFLASDDRNRFNFIAFINEHLCFPFAEIFDFVDFCHQFISVDQFHVVPFLMSRFQRVTISRHIHSMLQQSAPLFLLVSASGIYCQFCSRSNSVSLTNTFCIE